MRPFRDPLLWVALAAGPAGCVLLALLPGVRLAPALPQTWLAPLLAVLAYPPLEEWLFRGELQPWMARRLRAAIGPLTAANVATSAIFAGLHLFFHPPVWAAAVFLPSLLFGYFRERSGGLFAPTVLHAGYNAAYYLLLAAG